MSTDNYFKERIHAAGLKATPNRLAVLNMLFQKRTHPSAEQIFEHLKNNGQDISFATVYHILNTFEQKGIIKKVSTENGLMRYDGFVDSHYHLISEDGNEIRDYTDETLNSLIQGYFSKKNIPNFQLLNINLQLIGKFSNKTE